MFVLTVDQVGSRRAGDRVAGVLGGALFPAAVLGPDRTAGDEFQVLLPTAEAALDGVLLLARDGGWSIGVGIGAVALPLPATTREASGPALVAARAAVEAAKSAPHRVAVVSLEAPAAAADADGVLGLLLEVRARRSREGWEAADLLDAGGTQAEAAAALGITPQAVSLRARAAGLRIERDALPAIERLLARVDEAASEAPPTIGG